MSIYQEISNKLEQQIEEAKSILPDFNERNITIQTIPRIVCKDIKNNLRESTTTQGTKDADSYIFLRKSSSKDIVFPSGSIDSHEIHKGQVNPQGLLLAAMREFKEELLGILSIDIDNFIDTYPHIVFENNYQKYIQFRFLAKINPYKTENIEELFAKKYTKEHKRPEHDACYKASYTQALDYMRIGKRRLKHSTITSLQHHNTLKHLDIYTDRI